MKTLKLILITSLAILLILGIGNYFLRRGLGRGLREMESKGLGTQLAAPIMQKITLNLDGSPSPEIQPGFFQTFVQANEIGSVVARIRGPLPETSRDLAEIDPPKRVDPWGHTFCIVDLGSLVAVVSGGANAVFSACSQLRDEITAAKTLKPGFLYKSPKGALAVVVSAGGRGEHP